MERHMTPDELERFERERLHRDEQQPDAGPASEPDRGSETPDEPRGTILPPNPD